MNSLLLCTILPSLLLAQSTQPTGLDALNDEALMNELATRGLNSLLERAFEVNNVPETERQGKRTLIALGKLADPAAKLTSAQRQQLIAESTKGIDAALPTLDDPNLLMRQAFVLITQGVERDVNTLEYWGENPRTQANLRPTVQTVLKILERCQQTARAKADELSNHISAPNSPFIARYEAAEKLAATAEYTRNMAAYYLALAIDPASPQRKQVTIDAIEYLKQFDVPENPDRGVVHNRIAKLHLAAGEYDAARTMFLALTTDTAQPPPTVPQQYEARYFLAVSDLLNKKPANAMKSLEALLAWQDKNLPADPTARDGAAAAATMLRYRITSLEADLTSDPAQKKQKSDAAVAILMELLSKRPDLRTIIYEQLLPRLDEQANLSTVEPLLLRALVSRGEQELQKPAEQTADAKMLNRAIDAAHEIAKRPIGGGVDAPMVDAASLLVGFFYDRLGKKPDAANAFVDYVAKFREANRTSATLALDNAQALIGSLRASADTRDNPAVTAAYEKFLPLAIAPPFERKAFAFEYARRLQLNGKPRDAMTYYRLVPADDKRAVEARFLELVALKQELDDAPANAPDREALLTHIQTLADQVNRDATARGEKATLARTSLLAADVARREQHDPARALKLLADFEKNVAGLAGADTMINEAMYVRVQAYMADEKYTDATQQLVALLGKTGGSQGAQIVYNLLEKLNQDFDRAQTANDQNGMRTLARNRAQLSGFLVGWAEKNPDANIHKYTYRYRVFDAESQRLASVLESDAKVRAGGLKAALDRYRALQSADNVALYKASLPAGAPPDQGDYDPQVAFAIAQCQFDLNDFDAAATGFSKLLTERKLGAATISTIDNGQEKVVDNDPYWEAILRLMQCNVKLNRGLEESKNYLKQQYITWGTRVGGKKWKTAFEALRVEMISDFKVDAPPTTSST